MSQTSMSAALQNLQDLYSNNKFQEGIDLLLESKSEWDPSQFHELLGSFHMKLDHFAVARYHFEMAMSKGAIGPTLSHNHDYVLQQLGVSSGYYSTWMEKTLDFLNLVPFEIWVSLSLICLALSFWRMRQRLALGNKTAIIVFWLLALIPQIFYCGVLEGRSTAIVLQEAPLYEGPSAVFESPKTVRAGEKVLIDKSSDGWAFIVSPQVLSGWIESKSLGFLGGR